MPRSPADRTALLAVLAALLLPCAAARSAPPPEGRCPLLGGLPDGPRLEDAIPVPLKEGMRLGPRDLLQLQKLLPAELWRLRDVFFYAGMRMEVGPCHRRYPVASFYAEATQRFAGRARLDAEDNLLDYVAGLPFPPESIDPEAADAGARWAWDFEYRYRGAGPAGKFRIVDLPSRDSSPFTFEGSFFFLQTRHRADLAGSGYAVPEAGEAVWISGGSFAEPFNARGLAWRQLRPAKALLHYEEPDDTFVYVPNMRKIRRSATAWVDGVYLPRYRVGGDEGGGGIAIGGDRWSTSQGSIQPTAARSIHVTESVRVGFTEFSLRPNAYVWKVLGEREVLAPLNGSRDGYPEVSERNFGPSGLSVGSDRWDVRWAVVLAGLRRDPGGEFQRIELWLDWQTQQPLYLITKLKSGALKDITIPVHRFSGDLAGYPTWPGDLPARVFDPVAAVSYSALDESGWRRESYGVNSMPPDPDVLRRYTSTDSLMHGH